MLLDAGCEITFDVTAPTSFILMLRPRSGYGQWIAQERYALSPTVPVVEYVDSYGNLCQRLDAPIGSFIVTAEASVETAAMIDSAPRAPLTPISALPDYVLQFLLPSRYCPSDVPAVITQAQQIVASVAPGYDQAEAIRAWIYGNIEYRYGTSDATTTAEETLRDGVGVCRDFTHLGMALCRSLNIPARMVVGYLYQLDPMDLHAWFEAFIDGRWYTFDSTQSELRGGRITIAYGRDAADVALTTQFGPALLTSMRVWVNG